MHGTLRGDDDCATTREPTASPRISHFTVPLPLPLRDEHARSTNTETATIEQRSVRIARNHGEYRGRGEQGLVTGGVLKFSVAQTNDDEEEEKEEESIVAIETGDYAAPAVFRSRNADDNRANRAIIQLHGSIY